MVGLKLKNRNIIVIVVLIALLIIISTIILRELRYLSPKDISKSSSNNTNNAVQPDFSSIDQYHVLFGTIESSNTNVISDVNSIETHLGRKLDIVRVSYNSWQSVLDWAHSSGPLTNKAEYQISLAGRIPQIVVTVPENWNSMSFALHNQGSGRRNEVDLFAKNLQNYMPGPFLLTINDMPENIRNDSQGNSPQDYTDMQCAFYQVFKNDSVTKSKFVYETSNVLYGNKADTGARFYPGDQCTDWISAQVSSFEKDMSGNLKSLAQNIKVDNPDDMKWYDWAIKDWSGDGSSFNNPTRYGVVTDLNGKQETKIAKGNKPLMISILMPKNSLVSDKQKSDFISSARTDLPSVLTSIKAVEYADTNDFTSMSFQAWKGLSLTDYSNVSKSLIDSDVSSPGAKKRFTLL